VGLSKLLHHNLRLLHRVEVVTEAPGLVRFGLVFSFWVFFFTFNIYPWWARRRAQTLLTQYVAVGTVVTTVIVE